MSGRSILIKDGNETRDSGFILICAAYIVENDKVLLVHHNKFNEWVPPGGHIEPGETFATIAKREVKEETGLDVDIISTQPIINPNDPMAVAEPVPFYVDVEHGFKPRPAIVQFFWARRSKNAKGTKLSAQTSEVFGVDWITKEQLKELPMSNQIRTVAGYALEHHPDAAPSLP